jgi:phenylacetate-coenzyme A ligase PaaK-like adenylate-forming protein
VPIALAKLGPEVRMPSGVDRELEQRQRPARVLVEQRLVAGGEVLGRDRTREDLGPGGALLVTSWLNPTLPLIRYRIADAAAISSEPCPCGRMSPRILDLTGRQEDVIRLPGAVGAPVPVHPNHFEETIEERPEVARYQVVHDPESITVSVVARPGSETGWTDELGRELDRRLRTLGAEPPPIRIERVEELRRTTGVGAKLKVVRSNT